MGVACESGNARRTRNNPESSHRQRYLKIADKILDLKSMAEGTEIITKRMKGGEEVPGASEVANEYLEMMEGLKGTPDENRPLLYEFKLQPWVIEGYREAAILYRGGEFEKAADKMNYIYVGILKAMRNYAEGALLKDLQEDLRRNYDSDLQQRLQAGLDSFAQYLQELKDGYINPVDLSKAYWRAAMLADEVLYEAQDRSRALVEQREKRLENERLTRETARMERKRQQLIDDTAKQLEAMGIELPNK